MFSHNLKYFIKTLFRNKMLIFWTFAFPIILGTFFKMAFSDIESSEMLDIIDVAIVNDENYEKDEFFKNAFENLSDKENEDRLFDLVYTGKTEAKKMLEDEKISGYIYFDTEPHIVISQNGINETVIKTSVETITEYKEIVDNYTEEAIARGEDLANLNMLIQEKMESISNEKANIKDVSKSNMSYTMVEFYTLIAMAALYGGILSMFVISNIHAKASTKGMRVSIAPAKKGTMVLASMLASYLTQLIGLFLLFIYSIYVLKVDFGSNLPLIVLLSLVGSLAGLSLGVAVGTLVKGGESMKSGILLSITMLGSFLSGMMGITMKYIVDSHAPLVNIINPVNMITDGFYALYYYDTLDKFKFDVVSLLVFSGLMLAISISTLRRQRYDSI